MDLNSSAWRDLIFEGKNRKYGAYYLRRTSTKRHLIALAIVAGIAIVYAGSAFLIPYIPQSQSAEYSMLEPVNLSELSALQHVYFEEQTIPEEKDSPSDKEKINTAPEIVEEEIIEEIPVEPVSQESIAGSQVPDSQDNASLQPQPHETAAEDTVMKGETLPAPIQTQDYYTLQTAILRYIYQNLKYPDVAYKQRIQGRVICSFVINKDGSASDLALEKGVYIFLDEEAMRVLKSMPAWEPIRKDGKPIRVKYYLPIAFTL